MSVLNFPDSPILNDVYVFGERAWQWNGKGWGAYPSPLPGIYDLTVDGNVDISGDLNAVDGDVNIVGDISLLDGSAFSTTIQTITPTANRVISIPDATGTVALVAGSSGQMVWNNAGAYAGVANSIVDGNGNITIGARLINSVNAALSAPPVSVTGTWITTGGTATTTKPTLLLEPTGTTSTAWSTSGTGLGVNAPSGFAGNLLDLQVNGTSRLRVNSNGVITSTAPINVASLVLPAWIEATGGLYAGAVTQGIVPNSGGWSFQNWQGNNSVPVFFGPSTSSFPSFRTSGTALQCRLGDNSGYTTIDAQHRLQGTAPASATATGTAGDIRYDADFIYICTATNTWKRAALSTW